MGLANLVPGVSGGTMVLALGLYEEFIESFSNISRFKFSWKDSLFIATLFGISFLTILSLSGVIQFLMEGFRSEMLALFIGLTLGGVPILYKQIRYFDLPTSISCLLGIVFMGVIAFTLNPGSLSLTPVVFFLGGMIGSSAMILPGISGSYLLLVLGLYLPIITAINDFKMAMLSKDFDLLWQVGLEIVTPFALGMVVGILILSNVLNFLLRKYKRVTEGFLLGFLLGSVLGLYPFQPTSLDKLTKYSFLKNEKRVLKVLGSGFNDQSSLSEGLLKLKDYGVSVNIDYLENEEISRQTIDRAREERGVIIVYNRKVDSQIRQFSKNKKTGRVPLIIVPDTSFSIVRLLSAVILVFVGFFTTMSLGKLKK